MNYDIVVIGTGPGGYVAAIRAAQLGARVAGSMAEARIASSVSLSSAQKTGRATPSSRACWYVSFTSK